MRKTFFVLLAAFLAAVFVVPHEGLAQRALADGVCEQTSTGGPGPVALEGAITGGHRTFIDGVGIGAEVPYHIQNGNKIETGWGVVTAGTPNNTLTRVADWSTDGAGVELNLVGTSSVCIGTIKSYFTGGDGYGINADLLDGLNSTAFLQGSNNLSDVNNAATSFNNIKQGASTTATGVAEIATANEYRTGTDTGRVLGVDETWGGAAVVALSDATTIAVNFASGFNFSVSIGANRTLGNPTNVKVGQSGVIAVTASGATRTLAKSSNWKSTGITWPISIGSAQTAYIYYHAYNATNVIVTGVINNPS